MTTAPVFVIACSRSGTTLLGDLLGAHSDCAVIPEAHFVINAYRYFLADGSPDALHRAWARIRADRRYRIWGLDISGGALPDAGVSTYDSLIHSLVRRYAATRGKSRFTCWVDHTPMNVKYAASLDALFPGARFIHLVRDGRAVTASLLNLDWGRNTVPACAALWTSRVGYGLAAEAFLGPDRTLRVRYEDLLDDPPATLQRVCAFLRLPYQESMVLGGGFQVPGYTASQHALVGRPPDRTRAGAWRQKLTPRQVEIFEHLTCDYLTYLGYQAVFGLRARPITRREHLGDLARQALHSLLLNPYRRRKRASSA
jgi:hypothetical protein